MLTAKDITYILLRLFYFLPYFLLILEEIQSTWVIIQIIFLF